MKYILICCCLSVVVFMNGCAKLNPFNEPPDHPVIDSLSPSAGFVGTQIRIWGSGFSTNTTLDTIRINGVLLRVDPPSTSTVLLATLIDSTGTGKVEVSVNGKSAEGPVFTFLSMAGNIPVITAGVYGWQDGSGFVLTVAALPATDDVIKVQVAGINIPITEVTRTGTNNYEAAHPNRILLNHDALIEANATVNYAKFLVTYNNVPSNLFSVQCRPRVTDMFSGNGEYKFGVGDTLTVKGNFFGDGVTLPSGFNMLYNNVQLAQPNFIEWTNTEIKAIMPAYPELNAQPEVNMSVQVGASVSDSYPLSYLGVLSGKVTLLAGSSQGFSDGYGSAAQFNTPVGLVLNASGDLYVADQLNNRIRKITNISTAGGTVTNYAGSDAGFRDGGAADAYFDQPTGVAVDENGVVYVADLNNNRIRSISGGSVATFAGNGSIIYLYLPSGIAMNNHNLAYVADQNNNRLVEIINNNLFSLAGAAQGFQDGTGANALFNRPYGVTLAPNGNIYVADAQNHAIRKISPSGVASTFAGGSAGNADGTGTAAQFQFPVGIAADAQGNFFVADLGNPHIRRISATGVVTTLNPVFADGSGPANFVAPTGITVDVQGVLYVADGGSHRIYRMTQ